ncbi:hypothetical protein C6495_04210 [Candidatus Poribacteria bacterium]|nr:MAG: hypothetical protein C6495_04210 [Candidatus Poribacteria bacterium]
MKTQHAFRTAEISIHPNSTVAAARLHALFTFARVSDTALSLTITPTPPPITSVNPCCYRQEGALGGGLRLAHGAQDSISDIPYDQTLRAYKARLPVVCNVALRRSQPTGISAVVCNVALRRSQLSALVCRPDCAQAIAPYGNFRVGMSYEIQ